MKLLLLVQLTTENPRVAVAKWRVANPQNR